MFCPSKWLSVVRRRRLHHRTWTRAHSDSSPGTSRRKSAWWFKSALLNLINPETGPLLSVDVGG